MIDRLATALQAAITEECAKHGGACNGTHDGLLVVSTTLDPQAVARALLSKMREPTQTMVEAGHQAMGTGEPDDPTRGDAWNCYEAMIDGALDNPA